MQKATEYKVEDSNVEKIGSAEDKEARLAAAKTEKEWEGAGKVEGLEIWRVENRRTENDTPDFGVKRWPKEEYGRFYKGDSFSAFFFAARASAPTPPSRLPSTAGSMRGSSYLCIILLVLPRSPTQQLQAYPRQREALVRLALLDRRGEHTG